MDETAQRKLSDKFTTHSIVNLIFAIGFASLQSHFGYGIAHAITHAIGAAICTSLAAYYCPVTDEPD